MARKRSRADAFDRNPVPRVAAEQGVGVARIGIVGGAAGDDGDSVPLRQCFGDLRGHFRGGRSVGRIVFVQEQNVHAGELFCAGGAACSGFSVACGDGFFLQYEVAHHQYVHLRALKTIESFLGSADDGLIVVERSVQNDRHAGEVSEGANQFPVERVRGAADGLQARGAVHVGWSGNHGAFFRTHVVGESHKW